MKPLFLLDDMVFTTRMLVCGGREYTDKQNVFDTLTKAYNHYGNVIIIQGGARGADALAKEWAEANDVCCIQVEAHWKKLGKSAGAIRNLWMLRFTAPNVILAFPGGTGTAHMCKIAEQSGLPVYRVQ